MADTAKIVMDKERAAGNKDMWGFVFQGNAYEGLTCNALEWVKSNGGGQIIEPDGIDLDQQPARRRRPSTWPRAGSAPSRPPGVLAYQEEEARGVWQTGNAVFMRNWPYAYSLGNGADSPVKGKFDVAPLPTGIRRRRPLGRDARRLEPRRLQVLEEPGGSDRAGQVDRLAGDAEVPRAEGSNLPTIQALYDDADIAKEQPIIPRWKEVFLNAVPRPRRRPRSSTTRSPTSSGPPCTRRCPARAQPPTILPNSRST